MSGGAGAGAATGAVSHRRRRWMAAIRLMLEFAFLFLGTVAAKELLAGSVGAPYPNLLWLPIAVLTLQNGLACALAAAVIATALQYAGGLPPELLGEDIYSYVGRVAAEPIAWTCFALIFGHIRSRQIAHTAELETQLEERNKQCAAVADLCDDLRDRIVVLERQIAAAGQSSNAEIAEAVIGLHRPDWDGFTDRLRRFVVLMTGCPEFAIHLLRAGSLTLAFPPREEHRPAVSGPIVSADPLFEAIVEQRRILSARQKADSATLAGRAIMAGPISAGNGPQAVVGMLSIGGASPEDCFEDLGRRFSLALSEVSRAAGRLKLIERWQAAAAGISDGHGTTGEAQSSDRDKPLEAAFAEPVRQPALQ